MSIDGTAFKDEHGRTLLLRGVNLSGASKLPKTPASVASTSTPAADSTLYDHRNVSFVGRPFPLESADEHFARLRLWGLTFLRLLVTWEAIEHGGPGVYDKEYLDYLLAIVRKAAAHGISVFIDPHMDTWSRFSGGDGAPGWTLEVAGFSLPKIHASGAASLHQEEASITMMAWPTNNLKLAAATMYTLFFAGDDFAPKLKVTAVTAVTAVRAAAREHLAPCRWSRGSVSPSTCYTHLQGPPATPSCDALLRRPHATPSCDARQLDPPGRSQVEGEPIQQYLQRHYVEALRQVPTPLHTPLHTVPCSAFPGRAPHARTAGGRAPQVRLPDRVMTVTRLREGCDTIVTRPVNTRPLHGRWPSCSRPSPTWWASTPSTSPPSVSRPVTTCARSRASRTAPS